MTHTPCVLGSETLTCKIGKMGKNARPTTQWPTSSSSVGIPVVSTPASILSYVSSTARNRSPTSSSSAAMQIARTMVKARSSGIFFLAKAPASAIVISWRFFSCQRLATFDAKAILLTACRSLPALTTAGFRASGLFHVISSPDLCIDGGATVCPPVDLISTSVVSESLNFSVFTPSQVYHQCEFGADGRPCFIGVCGRNWSAIITASGQSRSISTSQPDASPRIIPMFDGSSLK